MFRKLNTTKARIAGSALLIVVLMVGGILVSEYLLQRYTTQVEMVLVDLKKNPSLPKEEVLTQVAALLTEQLALKFIWLTIISIVLLLLGLALLYRVIRKELQPLEQLQADMDLMHFDRNDTALPFKAGQSREMAGLTKSYNAMIESLKESYLLQQRFSQNAAHELKTPLTTMQATLEVHQMTQTAESAETVELLDILAEQVERMEGLVQGLLTLSRRHEMRLEAVAVRPLCEQLLANFQAEIDAKQLHVTLQGEMTVQTDRALLTVMVKNILENAIRYHCPEGRILVTLGDTIVIQDTGIGIPKEEQERVFSPFYCVDPSRSKRLGGMGLGLSIVAEAAEQLGFHLALESEVDIGTTVTLTPPKTAD